MLDNSLTKIVKKKIFGLVRNNFRPACRAGKTPSSRGLTAGSREKVNKDFLLEILTEELPPDNLSKLAKLLMDNVAKYLQAENLYYDDINCFATPRRLAVLVYGLVTQQSDKKIERKGPKITVAFNSVGKATKAAFGFAKSCGVPIDELMRLHNEQGEWLLHKAVISGEKTSKLLPHIVRQAINQLTISKPMRWGNNDFKFIRPVHGLVMLYGGDVVSCKLLGQEASNRIVGHRAHCKEVLKITNPDDYLNILQNKGYVIADHRKRKELIYKQIIDLAKQNNYKIVSDEDLLEEVTNITEWPVALLASFSSRFLSLPKEVLISTMKKHQKCFPLFDSKNNLVSYFITISNIDSCDPDIIVKGNERVMCARLSDAEFFYQTDLKKPLDFYVENLKTVVFQTELGTLFDKTNRIIYMAKWLADIFCINNKLAQRAAYLCKADLVTDMVGEFPELQGVMGCYYSRFHGEAESVTLALKEYYLPRFSNDCLPNSSIAKIIGLADRLDTLVGIFGINKQPTGAKDPFALRRAALGIVRILIDSNVALCLKTIIKKSVDSYKNIDLLNRKIVEQVFCFIMERFKFLMLSKGFNVNQINSVEAVSITDLHDFYCRLLAVKEFTKLSVSVGLSSANKRVNNILSKQKSLNVAGQLNKNLLHEDAEIKLSNSIAERKLQIASFVKSKNYVELLKSLAILHKPVDRFFDEVMVMTDNVELCNNRLILLKQLRELFLQVADVALL